MPHRGIDYAAPTGTRVKAAGDGVVVTASRTKANGKYIVLQHGRRHSTKYLHLSRFAAGIRKGRRVAQGETIGFVGATGWATGPHLHYEFLVDGVHKNPRTVRLPRAQADRRRRTQDLRHRQRVVAGTAGRLQDAPARSLRRHRAVAESLCCTSA